MPIFPVPVPSVATYTDLATMKSYLGITSAASDPLVTLAISAASRAVDKYCQRRFWLDPTPVARTFRPRYLNLLHLGPENDIGDLTGFGIKTDSGGKGTFDVTWSASDWQLLPEDAPYANPNPEPWTSIRAVGTRAFPWLYNTWLTRMDRVQVTARWGWPTVPDDVIQATMIKAARLYGRKDSPGGVSGWGDFGVVRVSPKEDPDVVLLLADYKTDPILVA